MELEQLIEKLKNGEDIVMLTFKTENKNLLVYSEWVTYTKDDYSFREENGEYYIKFKNIKRELEASKIWRYVK